MGWSNKGWIKKLLLTSAAAATALGGAAPAIAGGGHHRGHYAHGYYGPPHAYYAPGGYYYGSRQYRHRHHGGLSGGEAALLAVGIIGGAILIDRALEDGRYSERDAYDRYPPPRRDYYRRDDRPYDDHELDDELLGGAAGDYNYGAAYNDCKAQTRDAARDGGVIVALPARPERIIPIEDGAAVRFEASYLAEDRRGGEQRRTMVCEADERGVRFLELI